MKTAAVARQTALYLLLCLVSVLMLLPFAWVLFGAFKSQNEFLRDPGALLPATFANVQNFITLFADKQFGTYMVNSLIVSAVAVAGNILFSSLAGYALAKLRFRGRGVVIVLVLAAMTVPYVAVFVPQFLVTVQLGLVDTLAGIIVPIIVMPISVFIMRQFGQGVPDELLEAARIDGASEMRVFFGVFLPLLGPAVATVAIFSFLNSWNYFLWPLIVAQSSKTYTLPVGLAIASTDAHTTDYGVLLAGAVVILLPVLVLFLFLQRYFIQGVATTGLK